MTYVLVKIIFVPTIKNFVLNSPLVTWEFIRTEPRFGWNINCTTGRSNVYGNGMSYKVDKGSLQVFSLHA